MGKNHRENQIGTKTLKPVVHDAMKPLPPFGGTDAR